MRLRLRTLLWATDLSDVSNQALPFAVALAREFKARLLVCHAIDFHPTGFYEPMHVLSIAQQQHSLAAAQDRIEILMDRAGVEWESVVVEGSAADTVSDLARTRAIDLAIAATHGRSGFKRMILGSVTERLMRALPCPLFIYRPAADASPSVNADTVRLNRILVGCDFSTHAHAALAYGLSMAQEFESEVHLVHVQEPPVYNDIVTVHIDPADATGDADLQKRLQEKLDAMIPDEVRLWCTVHCRILPGHPYRVLRDYAADHAMDLVVLGVRGHSMMETLFLGSTTDRLIRDAPCPVLSVPDTVRA